MNVANAFAATRTVVPAFLAGLFAVLVSCGPSQPATPPPRLVIVYAPCTVNKRLLSPYDPSVPFTPQLQTFADRSVVFERHTTEAEQSGTAYASIFSGTQADTHGVYWHPSTLPDDLWLMSEAFAENGYDTWFWSGHPMADGSLGYGQGVRPEHTLSPKWPRRLGIPAGGNEAISANHAQFDHLLDGLVSDPTRRAYVQVNFTLTHAPYSHFSDPQQIASFRQKYPDRAPDLTPEEIQRFVRIYDENFNALQWDYRGTVEKLELSEADRAGLVSTIELLYEVAVHHLDALFGQFVQRVRARGLLEESLIVFTADHGEVLYRENALFHWTHGLQLAPESLDVPLLISAPGRLAPKTYDKVTRSIDVFPTVAGLCGIPIPAERRVAGVDLSRTLLGAVAAPDLVAFSHSTVLSPSVLKFMGEFPEARGRFPRSDPRVMWVRLRSQDVVCKLTSPDGEQFAAEVYDVASDPTETKNLYDGRDPAQAQMVRQLQEYKAKLIQSFDRFHGEGRQPRRDELERLRTLGYVK